MLICFKANNKQNDTLANSKITLVFHLNTWLVIYLKFPHVEAGCQHVKMQVLKDVALYLQNLMLHEKVSCFEEE